MLPRMIQNFDWENWKSFSGKSAPCKCEHIWNEKQSLSGMAEMERKTNYLPKSFFQKTVILFSRAFFCEGGGDFDVSVCVLHHKFKFN